jgi:hypothetical protein
MEAVDSSKTSVTAYYSALYHMPAHYNAGLHDR